MSDFPRIHVLAPKVAQKIAAGEVIERPSGVLRELLDNSLDAQANAIEVHLDGGGNEELRVVDDGTGMSKADLQQCYRAHATSKIREVTDLEQIRTLGFRGEALNAVASVSRLSITSAPQGQIPHELIVEGGNLVSLGPTSGSAGTTVVVKELFYNVPARRAFLKRGASESAVARTTFLDKALPFPEISFRFSTSGELRSFLPPDSLIGRITAAYPERTEPAKLQELVGSGDGFSMRIVAGEPSAHRRDRKQLQVFVNRRRIWEYALVQAVEYAYRNYLHGGLYPVAYLFLQVEPELVDFNIHPAKREVRFRNLPDIHKRIVGTLSGFLSAFDNRSVLMDSQFDLPATEGSQVTESAGRYGSPMSDTDALPGTSQKAYSPATLPPRGRDVHPRPGPAATFDLATRFAADKLAERTRETVPSEGFRYLGQIMNLFLVVEIEDTLYLVDQHAAHERVVYDRLRQGSGGQELLFPVALELDPSAAERVSQQIPLLRSLGIELEASEEGWELTSIPATLALSPEEIAGMLIELLDRPTDFERELFASLSCRSAVMDGDLVAAERAQEILSKVLRMDNARCPHGRPLWISFTKEHLAELVGRT